MAAGARAKPMRMCAACRRKAPQNELVRLAVAGGKVVRDAKRRVPGRGVYICPGDECLERLTGSKARNRAFRKNLGRDAWADILKVEPGPNKGLEE